MADKHGFTLLEVLVSVGIIAVISILIAQAFFSTTRTNTKAELLKDVKQNGDFATEVMSRMIRNARQVTSTCSSTGTTSTTFSIMNPDAGITTFSCVLDGTVTRIASTSAYTPGTPEYLTSNNLSLGNTCAVGGITFVCTKPANLPASVNLRFTLYQKGSPQGAFEQTSAAFQTTVALRN